MARQLLVLSTNEGRKLWLRDRPVHQDPVALEQWSEATLHPVAGAGTNPLDGPITAVLLTTGPVYPYYPHDRSDSGAISGGGQ